MRALILSALLLVVVPIAAADTALTVGPATVRTFDFVYGDGCNGVNGGETRGVQATIADPRGNGTTDAQAYSSCYRYDAGSGNVYSGGYDAIVVSNTQFNQQGPGASYAWFGGDSNGWKYCSSSAGTGTMYESLGCPSPDGSPPPMYPALP